MVHCSSNRCFTVAAMTSPICAGFYSIFVNGVFSFVFIGFLLYICWVYLVPLGPSLTLLLCLFCIFGGSL